VLKGEKVMLRAMRPEDLERLWEFNNDLEVELFGGGDPPYPQSLARLRADFEREWAKGGRDGSSFGIEVDGKFIGHCALFEFDHVSRTCKLGISIGDKGYWDKGYGRDAVRVLVDYAFRLLNQRKVWLSVNGNNERAIRAYRGCGFQEEGKLRRQVWTNGQYVDLVQMGILREEWDRLKTG
jgi:RimJ/RimL family protein N-acetyltransferase